MHISERLGFHSGRPVTAYQGEILSALEELFIEEDLLFLRCGPSITVDSDSGTTIVSIPTADRFGGEIVLVRIPTSALAPTQIKNAITIAGAVQETEQELVIVEQPGLPLMILCSVEVQRPYARDTLADIFREFTANTDLPVAGQPPAGVFDEELAEPVESGRA